MQIKYTTADGRLEFAVDVADDKQAFAAIGKIQEVFEDTPETINGIKVSPEDIKYRARVNGKYTFFEKFYKGDNKDLRGYYKAYSQSDDGLYPKRKDADGNWLPDNGWSKWEAGSSNGEEKAEEPAKAAPKNKGAKSGSPF